MGYFLELSEFRANEKQELAEAAEAAEEEDMSEDVTELEEKWEQEHDALLEKLVPIFESRINAEGKFERLVELATQIEQAMGEHVDYLPRQVLGYEVAHGEQTAFQGGLGGMLLHGQMYENITPEEILALRVKAVSQNKRSCEKIDPDFESKPEFSGAMKALKALGNAMFAGSDIAAVQEALKARLEMSA